MTSCFVLHHDGSRLEISDVKMADEERGNNNCIFDVQECNKVKLRFNTSLDVHSVYIISCESLHVLVVQIYVWSSRLEPDKNDKMLFIINL